MDNLQENISPLYDYIQISRTLAYKFHGVSLKHGDLGNASKQNKLTTV
jgi:hypothetical protein